MKKVLLFILILLSCIKANSQCISGNITDENNNPLSFANIAVLSGKDSTLLGGTVSDEQGIFQIEKIEDGSILKISYIGYKTEFINYTGQSFLTIALGYDKTLLKEVVVKATLPKTRLKGEGMITNVVGSFLAKTSSVYQMLNLVPMVSVQNENIIVLGRGTPLIYIDGRPMQSSTELQTLKPEEIKNRRIAHFAG